MSVELFHQSFNCHIDHTKHKVYISFQISRRVFLGLSAYKNVSFPLNSSNDASFYFMCERTDQAIVLVKISKTISVLGRIRNNLTVDTASKVHQSFVLPAMDYCDVAWSRIGKLK